MNSELDGHILTVLKTRPSTMTYVIANRLRYDHKKYNGTLKTSRVLRRLKALERAEKVRRVPSVYAVQLCWSLQPNV